MDEVLLDRVILTDELELPKFKIARIKAPAGWRVELKVNESFPGEYDVVVLEREHINIKDRSSLYIILSAAVAVFSRVSMDYLIVKDIVEAFNISNPNGYLNIVLMLIVCIRSLMAVDDWYRIVVRSEDQKLMYLNLANKGFTISAMIIGMLNFTINEGYNFEVTVVSVLIIILSCLFSFNLAWTDAHCRIIFQYFRGIQDPLVKEYYEKDHKYQAQALEFKQLTSMVMKVVELVCCISLMVWFHDFLVHDTTALCLSLGSTLISVSFAVLFDIDYEVDSFLQHNFTTTELWVCLFCSRNFKESMMK